MVQRWQARARSRVRIWPWRTQSRSRCGRGEPSFGADGCSDVADQRTELLGPQSKQTKGPIAAEHGHELALDVQRRGRRVSKDGACDLWKAEVVCEHHWSTPVSSCGGRQRVSGSPLPHLHRDWARPCHICTGTGLTPATSAPGLGSPLPHLHRDWARPCHSCTGTGLTRPHPHRDWAHPCHISQGKSTCQQNQM